MNWDNITIGNLQVVSVHMGNLLVWENDGVSIIISPTSLSVASGYSQNTISVDSSEEDWDVYSNDGWIYAEAIDDTTARIRCYQNPHEAERIGSVSFEYDGKTYATLVITQAQAPQEAFPTEWDVEDSTGDWALASMQVGTDTYFAVIYRYQDGRTHNTVSCTYDFEYEWYDGGWEESENVSDTISITQADTFYANGNTYYGELICTVTDYVSGSIIINDFTIE